MATVYLSSVPWDASGSDFPLLSHETLLYTMQQAGQVLETFTGISFVKDGSFELPIPYTKYQNACNYCVFNNGSGSTTTVFAFVTRMEWTSANSTRFYYEVDPFATYGASMRVAGARTRRRFATDTSGRSLYAGDYVGVGRKMSTSIINLKYKHGLNGLIVYLQTNVLSDPPNLETSYGGSELNTGLIAIKVSSSADFTAFSNFLKGADFNLFAPAIVGVYCVPSEMMSPAGGQGTITISGYSYEWLNPQHSVLGQSSPLLVDDNLLLNNNDTLIRVVTGGTTNYIAPSDLNSLRFNLYYAYSPVPCAEIIPDWKAVGDPRVYTFSNFAKIPVTQTGLLNWIQNNALDVMTGAVGAIVNPSISGTANFISSTIKSAQGTSTITGLSADAMEALGDSFVYVAAETWIEGSVSALKFYSANGYPDYSITNSPSELSVSIGDHDYFKYSNPIIAGVPADTATYIRAKLETGVRLWTTTTFNLAF